MQEKQLLFKTLQEAEHAQTYLPTSIFCPLTNQPCNKKCRWHEKREIFKVGDQWGIRDNICKLWDLTDNILRYFIDRQ